MPMRAPSTSIQPSIGDRLVVLGDLVVLRHVGIEVVLAGEDRLLRHAQVDRLGEAQGELDRLLVQHRAASPGSPRHTGQTCVLGSAPNSLGQPQNSLVAVDSSQCTSRPMTAS